MISRGVLSGMMRGECVVYEMWEMFHVKQQGEYVSADEVSGGGVMLLLWRL